MSSFSITDLAEYLMSFITPLAPIPENHVAYLANHKSKNKKVITRAMYLLHSSRRIFRQDGNIYIAPRYTDELTSKKALWILLDRYMDVLDPNSIMKKPFPSCLYFYYIRYEGQGYEKKQKFIDVEILVPTEDEIPIVSAYVNNVARDYPKRHFVFAIDDLSWRDRFVLPENKCFFAYFEDQNLSKPSITYYTIQ